MLEQILCADSPWTASTSLQGIVEEEEEDRQQQQEQHTELGSLMQSIPPFKDLYEPPLRAKASLSQIYQRQREWHYPGLIGISHFLFIY